MSFLNPVSEPVKRFSSTDAGAPQINYNARVAGDVKTVLKACLVVGYGTKASAGWSIVNEVDHVAEFVSPSTAMSDYRLGIDDSSAASTTWYYQYQDTRVNPQKNAISKNMTNINKTSAKNGWQLLVTARGLYFVEVMTHAQLGFEITRLTYWGQIKSALIDTTGKNIAFWSVGLGAPVITPYNFFSSTSTTNANYELADNANLKFTGANIDLITTVTPDTPISTVEMQAPLYLRTVANVFAGQHPAIILGAINDKEKVRSPANETLDNRPVFTFFLGYDFSTGAIVKRSSVQSSLYLDYWEY